MSGFTASLEVQMDIQTTCENCGNALNFKRKLKAVGSSSTVNRYGSQREADNEAGANLLKLIKKSKIMFDKRDYHIIEPEPCHSCHYIQSWMYDCLRKKISASFSLLMTYILMIIYVIVGMNYAFYYYPQSGLYFLLASPLIIPFNHLLRFFSGLLLRYIYHPAGKLSTKDGKEISINYGQPVTFVDIDEIKDYPALSDNQNNLVNLGLIILGVAIIISPFYFSAQLFKGPDLRILLGYAGLIIIVKPILRFSSILKVPGGLSFGLIVFLIALIPIIYVIGMLAQLGGF